MGPSPIPICIASSISPRPRTVDRKLPYDNCAHMLWEGTASWLSVTYSSLAQALLACLFPPTSGIAASSTQLSAARWIPGAPICLSGYSLNRSLTARRSRPRRRGYDLATYSRLHGFDDYVDRVGPLSLDRFLGYADWFAEQLVPDIRDLTVTSVAPGGDGFKVEFAEESPAFARQVIIATGLLPYAHIPDELSGLPADLMTHSSVHDRLDNFRGRRVAVIGAGQSALQTAALLYESGAEVQVIARRQQLRWEEAVPEELGLIDYVMTPPTKLCEGWGCVAPARRTHSGCCPSPFGRQGANHFRAERCVVAPRSRRGRARRADRSPAQVGRAAGERRAAPP